MTKKQKRTLKPILDPSASGKRKRLEKQTTKGRALFWRKGNSKFHD